MENLYKNIDSKKGNNHDNRNNRPVNCKTLDNPTFTQRKKHTYCWTHGGCDHDSTMCTVKLSNHKNEANFENKLGGSKYFCDWLLETDDDYVIKQHRVIFIKEKSTI